MRKSDDPAHVASDKYSTIVAYTGIQNYTLGSYDEKRGIANDLNQTKA